MGNTERADISAIADCKFPVTFQTWSGSINVLLTNVLVIQFIASHVVFIVLWFSFGLCQYYDYNNNFLQNTPTWEYFNVSIYKKIS